MCIERCEQLNHKSTCELATSYAFQTCIIASSQIIGLLLQSTPPPVVHPNIANPISPLIYHVTAIFCIMQHMHPHASHHHLHPQPKTYILLALWLQSLHIQFASYVNQQMLLPIIIRDNIWLLQCLWINLQFLQTKTCLVLVLFMFVELIGMW